MWDPGSSTVKCDYCLSEFTIEQVEEFNRNEALKAEVQAQEDAQIQNNLEEKISHLEAAVTGEIAPEDQDFVEELGGYTCNNCGAEVVTKQTTASTFCFYCHSPVIVTDQISGKFRPDYIIPFHIDGQEAQRRFLEWAKKKKFIPKSFYSESQLEKMTGMYLPVWLADVRSQVYFRGKGVNTQRLGGDREEIREYAIVRQGEIESNKLVELAYTQGDKISPQAFESVASFNWDELKDFSPAYLSGFYADVWSVSPIEAGEKAVARAEQLAEQTVMNQIQQAYQNVTIPEKQVDAKLQDINFALAPAWVLSYFYNDKYYLYVLNGQSGNAYGELPLDRGKLLRTAGFLGLGILVLLLILAYFFLN